MHAPLQDLISFASPSPAAKTARPSLSSDLESLSITNNNNGGTYLKDNDFDIGVDGRITSPRMTQGIQYKLGKLIDTAFLSYHDHFDCSSSTSESGSRPLPYEHSWRRPSPSPPTNPLTIPSPWWRCAVPRPQPAKHCHQIPSAPIPLSLKHWPAQLCLPSPFCPTHSFPPTSQT